MTEEQGNAEVVSEEQVSIPATEETPTPAEPQLSQEAQQYSYERDMFVRGAEANQMNLPGNFKDFGDYFDSLKEAQGQYTAARQELAQLKADEATRFATGEQPEIEAETEGSSELPENLEIKEPEAEVEADPENPDDYEVYEVGMTEEEGMQWTAEFMETGELTEDTMNSILNSFPGATPEMVMTYFEGIRAVDQTSMMGAAETVGGVENLNNILAWAGENLSPAEREAANEALSGPMANYTLMGLQAQYQNAISNTRQATEPSQIPGRVATSSAAQTIQPYDNRAQMNADMSNPQYYSDPNFRSFVEQRLRMTPWVTGG